MRFLVDNSLSSVVADGLRAAAHDVLHVRDLGMQAAEDGTIFQLAARSERIVVTADLDFGTLLALGHATEPSVVRLRRVARWPPEHQVRLILANLPQIAAVLEMGCIVIIEPDRVCVHMLPIGGDR